VQGRKKIKLVQLFTEMRLTVVISDVDTVWLRNPFAYFKRYPEADILTSSDSLRWTHEDEGLEDARRAQAAFNIGIMLFSPNSVDFAKRWVEVIEADYDIWDQNAFNECAPAHLPFVCVLRCGCMASGAWASCALVQIGSSLRLSKPCSALVLRALP
jgi:Nucleotide-diphospho-sugar transferase